MGACLTISFKSARSAIVLNKSCQSLRFSVCSHFLLQLAHCLFGFFYFSILYLIYY